MSKYRFGKHPPKADYRTLRFAKYLTPRLEPPPETCDILPRVYEHLGTHEPTALFPMDGNDRLGDCTIAAVAHAITVYSGLVRKRGNIMPTREVTKLYLHLTGGVDSGLNELDVLNYWQTNSVNGDQLLAFVGIGPKNHVNVMQAVRLFGGAYIGFQVQQNCVEEFDARQPWTPGPLTTDGHAVFVTGYDQSGVTVLTWGNTQKASWAWWDECVDEAYALLPPEAQEPDFAPGFDFEQLQRDLEAVAQ